LEAPDASMKQLLLSDRLAAMGTLAHGLAHEINNPLAAIVANLDVLASEIQEPGSSGLPPADVRDCMNDPRQAVEPVNQLMLELRHFTCKTEQPPSPVDLRDAIEWAERIAIREVRSRARIVHDFGDVPHVVGYESRLGQLILNLILYSAQWIPKG